VLGRLASIAYAGNEVACPCCGGTFRAFRLDGRACPRCGSLERARLLCLYFERHPESLRAGTRLLHFAPEYSLTRVFRDREGLDYVTADLDSPLADDQVDITRLPYEDASFDATLCCHVLEHVPDDRTAIKELWRVLRPGGWAIVMVPVDENLEATFEDPSVTEPAERQRVFGQHDHVRLYGRDLPGRLGETGFSVAVDRFADDLPDELVRRSHLRRPPGAAGAIPGERDDIYFCTKPAAT
jgi:SAM-dependent methyltransferase